MGLRSARGCDLAALARAAAARPPAPPAGAGFTASLLIASRAFDGALLDQAKAGILATALLAPLLAVAATRVRRLPVAAPCAAR